MRHILTLLLLAVFAFAHAQHIDAKKLDAYLHHIETYDQGVGSISIFRNGKEVYKRDFGQSAIPDLKHDANTKYQVGSITKVFTAALVWKLIEDRKLRLDTRLSEYYPQIPNAKNITIRQMLEHTSGLGDIARKNDTVRWLSVKVGRDEIMSEIEKQGVTFEAGQRVRYSNTAYYLLREIVEKNYGSRFGKILKNKIVSPNRLGDLASADANPKNIFIPYAYQDKAWAPMGDFDFRNTVGVGDISATPEQLNRFFYNLFHGKIVNPESLAQMIPTEKEDWGRNLMAVPFKGRMLYGHAGDTYGTHSIAVYDVENDINVAICINGRRLPQNDLYIGIFDAIYSENAPLPFFVKTQDLEKYTGNFQATDDATALELRIFVDTSGKLMCEDVLGEITYPITPTETDKFAFKHSGITFDFSPDGVLFEQDGIKLHLRKMG